MIFVWKDQVILNSKKKSLNINAQPKLERSKKESNARAKINTKYLYLLLSQYPITNEYA
jgi:hypothetical protein